MTAKAAHADDGAWSITVIAMMAAIPSPAISQAMDPTIRGMAATASAADPHAGMAGMAETDGQAMMWAFGFYPMTREASGTSWQTDASTHDGLHRTGGGW